MSELYSKPLRVYLIMIALALWGLLSASQLSVSLFPMSSQPSIQVYTSYGSYTGEQFFNTYGSDFEAKLKKVKLSGQNVRLVTAEYERNSVRYRVQFDWGSSPAEALREIETVANSFFASAEFRIRDSLWVGHSSQNQGFFIAGLTSSKRTLTEIYDLTQPLVTALKSRVPDTERVEFFNPARKEISIQLSPEKLALYAVTTSQIESRIRESLVSLNGGTLKAGTLSLQLSIPKASVGIEELSYIRVSSDKQIPVLLKDVAEVALRKSMNESERFRSNGRDAVILYAEPRQGGNIKEMSEALQNEVDLIKHSLPSDISFDVLVNPADSIGESVRGVFREVGLAAFLAVFVLFLFIGSFKNVVTAAIEIPLSLIMAFILMKLSGMNLNMISLGGLALSAGMNVDASVVVLENIFRHFDGQPANLPVKRRMQIILDAVNEVKLPIVASTIASLVVFTPLVFTRGLTDAILGDLAKAVIFSHGLSAVVALVLVPTIRFHMLRAGPIKPHRSPIEKQLLKLEEIYAQLLSRFLRSTRAQWITLGAILILLPALGWWVLPRLQKEVIGRPESAWVIVGTEMPLSQSPNELDSSTFEMESTIQEKFGSKIESTMVQSYGNTFGKVMVKVKDRSEAEWLMEQFQSLFKDSSTQYFWTQSWNPSELQIPDPSDFRVDISGGTPSSRFNAAEDLRGDIADQTNMYVRPSIPLKRTQQISIEPLERFRSLGDSLSRAELSHYLRTATLGMTVEYLPIEQRSFPAQLNIDPERVHTLDQIRALPVGLNGKLIPLSAVAEFRLTAQPPDIYRENLQTLISLSARVSKVDKDSRESLVAKAHSLVRGKQKEFETSKENEKQNFPILTVVEPDTDLKDALQQLLFAVVISILLVFLVMVIQLGDFVQALLVIVAIPLGLIGVLASLYAFKSTLSLNSGLGTILLNGIAVANSIILVDFIQKVFAQGHSAYEATIRASRARLRPILMTSLTTVLGMIPVAVGLGEGGKILQPLGIAVCGGLWVSALMTLFVVPALQYHYLLRKDRTRWAHSKPTDRVVADGEVKDQYKETMATTDFDESKRSTHHLLSQDVEDENI